MIYKLIQDADSEILSFGIIGPEHWGTSADSLCIELDASFESCDALYSFHNIPIMFFEYNNKKYDEDELILGKEEDWYIRSDFNCTFEYRFIKNIPESDWYTWEQTRFIIETLGHVPLDDADLYHLELLADKEEYAKFQRSRFRLL